jgi:drug/metabolite transporter (DMT)-like permease
VSEGSSLRSTIVAPLYVIIAATLWGTTGIAVKMLNTAATSPLLLAAARNLLATILIGIYLLLTDRQAFHIKRRDILGFIFFGVVGVGLCQLSYMFTVTQAHVSVAVLLQSLAPAFAYTWALLSHGEKRNNQKLSALALALSGGAIVVLGQGGWGRAISLIGLISGVSSGLCWAFYGIYAKHLMRTYAPWTLLFWGNAISAIAWWSMLSPSTIVRWLTTTPNAMLVTFYLAAVCTAIPSWFFLKGVRVLTPSTAGIIGAFEPVAAAVIAYLVLQETLTLVQIIGGLVIIATLILLQRTTVGREARTEQSPVIMA